jgi:hypothetical protein
MTSERKMELLTAVLATAGMLCAQETRKTVTNPSPNPKDDAKPNSNSVPDAYALTGHFDRIVVVRLKNKANLLGGITKVVQEQHIQNGVFLSGIGSLRGYEVHSVTNRDLPTEDTFVKNPTQPADLCKRERICDQRPHSCAHDASDAGQSDRRSHGSRERGLHIRDHHYRRYEWN